MISVTVLDSKGLKYYKLIEKMIQELKTDFNIKDARLIKLYQIPYALPKLDPPVNTFSFAPTGKTFEVVDFLMNGSQNAACKIGELVAEHILKGLE